MQITTPRIFNWLLIFAVIYTNLNLSYWKKENKIIEWDVISYYAYLPATFIYHDPALQFVDNAPEEVRSKIWFHTTPSGGRAVKTSMGMSVLYAPFFFLGHIAAPLLGFDANGYSTPYRFALIMSCIFYLAVSLYFLRRTLSMFFPPWVVIITTIGTILGTNLFYYSTTEPTMSHAYSFFMFTAFIYLTIKWYEKSNILHSILLGLLIGLISLTRPTNILIILLFLLWNIKSFNDLKNRITYFICQYKQITAIIIFSFIVWIPQFLWWKTVSGQWLYFSYGDERFFFLNPQITNGLFSYRKGWLLYTPIMIFAIIGIPVLYKHLRAFFIPILVFTILNIYIILSWWSWWYGGGFGLRAFIDSYAIMAIPLAAFTYRVSGNILYKKILTSVLLMILTAFNLFQTLQYRYGTIHFDSMTKDAYWASFGKLHNPANFYDMLACPDYEKAKKGIQAVRKCD